MVTLTNCDEVAAYKSYLHERDRDHARGTVDYGFVVWCGGETERRIREGELVDVSALVPYWAGHILLPPFRYLCVYATDWRDSKGRICLQLVAAHGIYY